MHSARLKDVYLATSASAPRQMVAQRALAESAPDSPGTKHRNTPIVVGFWGKKRCFADRPDTYFAERSIQ